MDGLDFLEMELIGRSEPLDERVCVTRTDFSFRRWETNLNKSVLTL